MNDEFSIEIRCPNPKCTDLGPQHVTLSRSRIKEMLRRGDEIAVLGETCGHTWVLSPIEEAKLSSLLAVDEDLGM
jgi:hypothetical protein